MDRSREFLKHAAVWLGCRLVVMGGEIDGPFDYYGGMEWFMLGYHDLAHEMRLILGGIEP